MQTIYTNHTTIDDDRSALLALKRTILQPSTAAVARFLQSAPVLLSRLNILSKSGVTSFGRP